MVPSRILCTPGDPPRVHVWDSFRFFTFLVHGCGILVWCTHKLYWSRNNKIENRIFCPQESTIAISRCLLLLPAVQSPCCAVVHVPDQHSNVGNVVFSVLLFSIRNSTRTQNRTSKAKTPPSPSSLNGSLQYGPHQPGGKSRSTLADLILSLH